MTTLGRLEDEMHRLIGEAQKRGIFLRLIGGLAVKMHCPHATHRALMRDYPDIDFVTTRTGALKLEDFLTEMGYVSNKTFNTLNGDRRQLFYDTERSRQIDIFVGEFAMCHKLPLADRLEIEPLTIPLAELFLSKAQIVELNRKDALDLLTLLLDHDAGDCDEETINAAYISVLCAKDWGLYTTISMTIDKLRAFMEHGEAELLNERLTKLINDRLSAIQDKMDAAPKTMAWKLRAKVGKRLRWYDEVEEVQRG